MKDSNKIIKDTERDVRVSVLWTHQMSSGSIQAHVVLFQSTNQKQL